MRYRQKRMSAGSVDAERAVCIERTRWGTETRSLPPGWLVCDISLNLLANHSSCRRWKPRASAHPGVLRNSDRFDRRCVRETARRGQILAYGQEEVATLCVVGGLVKSHHPKSTLVPRFMVSTSMAPGTPQRETIGTAPRSAGREPPA
jgi:hypothetical protein